MRNVMNLKKLAVAALLGVMVIGLAGTAEAGRGSNYSAIMSAINSRNADSIINELERAEKLICTRCIDPVIRLLDNEDYRIREVAAWWITRRPVTKRIVAKTAEARLRGTDPRLARNAADTLGTFQHPDAIPVLVETVGRSDFPSYVRASALQALGRIGSIHGEAAIIAGLSDTGGDARMAAVEAYMRLRGRDGAPLATLAGDSDAGVRLRVAQAAGRYRLEGARAGLEQVLLTDADPMVRRNAAWALGKIGNAASRTVLEQAAANDDISYVRSAANLSLRSIR
jgi:HEAT repeat protein